MHEFTDSTFTASKHTLSPAGGNVNQSSLRQEVVLLPGVDEWGVPLAKMPRCPRCNADELGMIHEDYALCYACSMRLYPA